MLQIFGTITDPTGSGSQNGSGLFSLINSIFKLSGAIAGIYLIIQLIMAGYGYLSANGDSKKTQEAWAKIYQSIIGLVIVASAFVIASIVGALLNIDILEPTIEPI